MQLSAFISELQNLEKKNPNAHVVVSGTPLTQSEILSAKTVLHSKDGKQYCQRILFNKEDFDIVIIGQRSNRRTVRAVTNDLEPSTHQHLAAIIRDVPHQFQIPQLAHELNTRYTGLTDIVYYFDPQNFFVGRELCQKFPDLTLQKSQGWEFIFQNYPKTDRLRISTMDYPNFVEKFGRINDKVADAISDSYLKTALPVNRRYSSPWRKIPKFTQKNAADLEGFLFIEESADSDQAISCSTPNEFSRSSAMPTPPTRSTAPETLYAVEPTPIPDHLIGLLEEELEEFEGFELTSEMSCDETSDFCEEKEQKEKEQKLLATHFGPRSESVPKQFHIDEHFDIQTKPKKKSRRRRTRRSQRPGFLKVEGASETSE